MNGYSHRTAAALPRPTTLPDPVAEALAPLTPAERKFVIAYCTKALGNATRAAAIATGATTHRGQRSRGGKLVHKPAVRHAIGVWMEHDALTAGEVMGRLSDIATASLAPFLEDAPHLRFKPARDPVWLAHEHWIRKLEFTDDGRVKTVELHDSHGALRDMAKVLKLFSDAPVVALHLHVQHLSDDELIQRMRDLDATDGPVAVLPAPGAAA